MNEWLSALFCEQQPVVLRLRLRPMTIGHRLLLSETRNGFLTGEPDFTSLLIGSLICSQDHDKAKAMLGKWWLKWFCKFWGWTCRNLDVKAEASKFATYIDAADWLPNIAVSESARETQSPFELRKVLWCMTRLGMSFDESLNMPISRITALEFCDLENEGRIQLVDDGLASAFELARQLEKEQHGTA